VSEGWWAADCFALVNEADVALDFLERAGEFGFINAPGCPRTSRFSRAFGVSRDSVA
jgi:hypothetical protein